MPEHTENTENIIGELDIENIKKVDDTRLLLSQGTLIAQEQLAACKPFILKRAELHFNKKQNDDGIAVLKLCIDLYPNDIQLIQEAKFKLAQHYYNVNPYSKESILAVLALDATQSDTNKQFKEQVIREYFAHTKPNHNVNLILPILEHSHTNPALAYDAITQAIPEQSEQRSLYVSNPKPAVLNSIKAATPAKLGWWQKIKEWFRLPSDIEKLKTELLKNENKQNPAKIKSLLRNIYLKNEKLPQNIFEQNPDVVISALKAIRQETPYKQKMIYHDYKSSRDFRRIWNGDTHNLPPGEIHFQKGYSHCFFIFKDANGVIHKEYEPYVDSNNNPSNISSFITRYIQNKDWPVSNLLAINNASRELENYYFTLASDYFSQHTNSNQSDFEKTELLDKALKACLQLPPSDSNYNFKEMIVNTYLGGMEGNIMQPLSEPLLSSLQESHVHPELTYGILQAEN